MAPSTTAQPQATSKAAESSKSFRLLHLPGELRNIVYEKVAEDEIAVLKGKEFKDSSGLLNVGGRVQDEYSSMLLLAAGTIRTHVSNFDFSKLITFLNRLSDVEIKALSFAKSTTRRIEVQLTVTQHSDWGNRSRLERWLNRAGHPTKKGTMLDISYTFSDYHTVSRDSSVATALLGSELFHWARSELKGYIEFKEEFEEEKSARSAEEAKKILALLDNSW